MTKKKELEKLLDYAYDRLCDIGTWVSDYGSPPRATHEFVAQTKHGELHLSLSPDYITTGREVKVTVFAKFKEPARAQKHLYGVSNTGKWNWHGLNKEEFDSLFIKLQELRTDNAVV